MKNKGLFRRPFGKSETSESVFETGIFKISGLRAQHLPGALIGRNRFEATWTTSLECADIIQQTWCSASVNNSRQVLIDRIRASRTLLIEWKKGSFGNIRRKTQELNAAICKMQEQTIMATSKSEIESLKDSLDKLAVQEEILWKQRVKALWLEAGDRNTNFSHAKANERQVRKDIKRLKNENGVEVTMRRAFGLL
ncbi:UNVERIFIED_CONTAM: hypothetical protein Slati_3509000 [Sesamum latifolium]|uniref:Uncharacterized protein n=1 Tax=Sesamum latifolium TaxID=2727402 RepID=A0AAW2UN28_9LAMI